MKALALLIETELEGLESRALVRRIAEWLVRGKTARAVVVVFGTEHRLLDEVGAELGGEGERRLVCLEPALEGARLVLKDLDSGVSLQVCVQVRFRQVRVSLLQRLPLPLVLAEEVVGA